MATKKEEKHASNADNPKQDPKSQEAPKQDPLSKLPKEAQEKLKKIKEKLDKYQKNVLEKFDKYIMGIALMPPPKPKENEKVDKDKVYLLILVDDSDSKKMSKLELKDKLTAILNTMAQDVDKSFVTQTIILSELWQSCYDGKTEVLQSFAVSAPVYDTGMLAAIKISEIQIGRAHV